MPSKTDTALAHSIRDIVTKLNRRMRKQINMPGQVSVSELYVIQFLLERKFALPSELCMQFNISSQHMSQMLNRLEQGEYVKRTPSQQDKRKTEVSLTEKGRKMIKTLRQEREVWLSGAMTVYSADEKAILQKAVALLARLPEL